MFYVTKTKECREKNKRHLSFPPPWEPWTPFSSLGTLDFLSTCLGTDSLSIKLKNFFPIKFSSVQLLSHVRLLAIPWTAAHQASLSVTNCWSLLKLMSIKMVMPSNHLLLCRPFLLLPSIFPSIRVFFNESALRIRWPKYWISIVAILVCMPTNSVRGLPFLCTLSSNYCL